VRNDLSVSAGLKEVLRPAMEEVGACLLRIFDRVERSFRRMRWGRMVGIDGQERGRFDFVKKRCVESSPRRGA